MALAAQEYGLGTCILGEVAAFPEDVKRIANIPESKRPVIAIAIGYPDWEHPYNSFRTDREPIEKLVTWRRIVGEREKQWRKLKGSNKNVE
ncbi:nitroreductase family protein [Candidatus Aerophobetes bacterium]|nr:nitroreductase family protein [Candidatus Aerophobetes bacterium]